MVCPKCNSERIEGGKLTQKAKHDLPVGVASVNSNYLFLWLKHNHKQILIKCKYIWEGFKN